MMVPLSPTGVRIMFWRLSKQWGRYLRRSSISFDGPLGDGPPRRRGFANVADLPLTRPPRWTRSPVQPRGRQPRHAATMANRRRKERSHRHWAEPGKIVVERAAWPEYLNRIGAKVLDKSRYEVSNSIIATD